MARGVTQDQVNAAIDALIGAGERPTIERVRAALGTGSPNTLTRMLESWWATLGNRLAAQQQKVALPDAPAEVAALASQLWERALSGARAEAGAALQGDRAQLEADRAQLASEKALVQQTLETHRQAVAAAQQAQSIAETRLADSQQLADRQSHQLADVLRQRDALQTRNDQLAGDLTTLAARLRDQEAAATAEREAEAQHLRAIEARSHLEIDRARQETKDLRAQLAVAERERTSREQQRDEARAALAAAQRETASLRSRSEAIEEQLARLSELHATLQSTLAHRREITTLDPTSRRKKPASVPKRTAKVSQPRLPARR